jgi:gluconate 2-dehydrogenase gamma chain
MQPGKSVTNSIATDRVSPALMFFNELEARTVEAVVARVIPSEPNAPGAREAGVVIYIDRAVAGYFRDHQALYRAGIQELNDFSESRCGAVFADLSEEQQDAILVELDGQKRGPSSGDETLEVTATGDALRSSPSVNDHSVLTRFFAVVCDQTIQGMFCDPMYGGNHNGIGWKLIGFPGAQWAYSVDQLRPGFDASTIPVQTLSDLRRRFAGEQHG